MPGMPHDQDPYYFSSFETMEYSRDEVGEVLNGLVGEQLNGQDWKKVIPAGEHLTVPIIGEHNGAQVIARLVAEHSQSFTLKKVDPTDIDSEFIEKPRSEHVITFSVEEAVLDAHARGVGIDLVREAHIEDQESVVWLHEQQQQSAEAGYDDDEDLDDDEHEALESDIEPYDPSEDSYLKWLEDNAKKLRLTLGHRYMVSSFGTMSAEGFRIAKVGTVQMEVGLHSSELREDDLMRETFTYTDLGGIETGLHVFNASDALKQTVADMRSKAGVQ